MINLKELRASCERENERMKKKGSVDTAPWIMPASPDDLIAMIDAVEAADALVGIATGGDGDAHGVQALETLAEKLAVFTPLSESAPRAIDAPEAPADSLIGLTDDDCRINGDIICPTTISCECRDKGLLPAPVACTPGCGAECTCGAVRYPVRSGENE